MPVLTRDQVRRVDELAVKDFHLPSIVLMENAGRGAAETMIALGIHGEVVILCGAGNNGGDGLVVARHLDCHRFSVQVICVGEFPSRSADVETNYRIAKASGIRITHFEDARQLSAALDGVDWIVDGMLGTGAVGSPRSPIDVVIKTANDAAAKRLALDLPSGLDCDTGQLGDPTFIADHTCTFVAAKPGLLVEASKRNVGQVHVIGIAAPRELIAKVAASD